MKISEVQITNVYENTHIETFKTYDQLGIKIVYIHQSFKWISLT